MAGIFDTGIFDTGIFDTPNVVADANTTQAANEVSATGAVTVKGTLSQTQAANTVSATGAVAVQGTLSQTQAGDTLSAEGIGAATTSGSLDQTQAADTVSAVGAVTIKGALSQTQAANTVSAVGAVLIRASASLTEASDSISSAGSTAPYLDADLTQDSQTVLASATVPAKGALNATQEGDSLEQPPSFVVAPSYGTWVKRQNKNKPQAPQLPPPVQPGEVVVDEAVIQQMEEERLAALVLAKKTEALETTQLLRATVPVLDDRPSKSITLNRERFDVVDTSSDIRRAVVTLFRSPPEPPLTEPVRGSITLRALGPRHLPQPEMRKSKTISLRRSSSQSTHSGLSSHG